MCGGIREKISKQGSNKERADVSQKKLFSFEEMYALSIYKATPFLARPQFLEFLRQKAFW